MVCLTLNPKASDLARRGRPWFFRDDLASGELAPARMVRVADEHGRGLGLGITGRSKIALRLCGPWPGDEVPGREEFFHARLASAFAARSQWLAAHDGCRLVHGESDWLPGLVLDRYGAVLSLQATSQFVAEALDAIVPFAAEQLAATCVVARHDTTARRFEGLSEGVELLHGQRVDEVTIVEHGVRHKVRPFLGHKTGFYLDQRPARQLVQQLARGRRVLDLFCYQGAFSLSALVGGAVSAVGVDQSEAALSAAVAGAAENGVTGFVPVLANAFDFLREARGRNETFDLIVLDPPAFAKSRRELPGAENGYRDLNRQALRMLAPGGHLLTCSCSHHMTPERFAEVVRQATAGLPFRVILRERLMAGADHPVLVNHPESEYLKVLHLQRLDA